LGQFNHRACSHTPIPYHKRKRDGSTDKTMMHDLMKELGGYIHMDVSYEMSL
jgi:hypothetical protein